MLKRNSKKPRSWDLTEPREPAKAERVEDNGLHDSKKSDKRLSSELLASSQ